MKKLIVVSFKQDVSILLLSLRSTNHKIKAPATCWGFYLPYKTFGQRAKLELIACSNIEATAIRVCVACVIPGRVWPGSKAS